MSSALWTVVAIFLALGLAGAGGYLWVRRRKARLGRKVARAAPHLRYPVVLAHGFCGFDELKLGPLRHEYFREIQPRLRQLGARVYAVRVSPSASIPVRAAQLAKAVRDLDAGKVNIIAHSMGGLDARYAVSQLGLGDKVASLTTVGTPHRGTPLADLGTALTLLTAPLRRTLAALGFSLDALDDLTPAKMEAFNRGVRDVGGVCYASVIAHASGRLGQMNPLLMPTYLLLSEKVGQNDGIVPLASQPWGEIVGRIEADHWAQIGWSKRFDAPALYAGLLAELRGRGF